MDFSIKHNIIVFCNNTDINIQIFTVLYLDNFMRNDLPKLYTSRLNDIARNKRNIKIHTNIQTNIILSKANPEKKSKNSSD